MKYFKPQELVPKVVFDIRGDASIQLFDVNLLRLADLLRERYGAATINNWHVGGNFSQSGLRTVEFYGSYDAYHKSFSQHKYGRALDMKFSKITAQEVRLDLAKNWENLCAQYPFPISLEEDVSWLHIDTRFSEKMVNFFKG